jgi:hypothetical protein
MARKTKEDKDIEAAEEIVAEISTEAAKIPEGSPDPKLVAAVAQAVLAALQSQPGLAPVTPAPTPPPRKPIVVESGTDPTVANRRALSGASPDQHAAMNKPNASDGIEGAQEVPDPVMAEAPKSILEHQGGETGRIIQVAQN